MSRKKLRKAAKVLGGLGAAYVAKELAKDNVIDLRSPEQIKAQKARDEEAIASLPRYTPSDTEQAEMVREDARRRAGLPVITEQEIAEKFEPIKNIARTSTGLPLRTADGVLGTQQYKKGGTAKGWGKARGARAAKVY